MPAVGSLRGEPLLSARHCSGRASRLTHTLGGSGVFGTVAVAMDDGGKDPGWYPDPNRPGSKRYWDGTQWHESLVTSGWADEVLERWRRHRVLAVCGLLIAALFVVGGTLLGDSSDSDPSRLGVESSAPGSGDQYELAREIGYELCADPIYPDKAAADPVGYAEEEFGGPGEFDQAREIGCLDALGQ